ncbi:MAG: preprotein translocase subunit YajC [Bacteroidaceae bacterium]|nr:preprotein translocase subunit YajC [Bacteroidaceae bacterium]
MNPLFITLQAAAGGQSGMSFIIMMVAIFAIMWFFMIRPQQKKQKEIKKFQDSLAIGSQVYTQGGIIGKVVGFNEVLNTVQVEIAKGVVISVFRSTLYNNEPTEQK